jgi:putative redox protein
MDTRTFDFDGHAGFRLAGRLEMPPESALGWAILAHCFTCGKDHLAAARVAKALARRGIGTLRFDFAGLGKSGGEFAESTFAGDTSDLVAASQAMADEEMAPSLLVGHSLGGAAALAAAGRMPTIRAVATIGAPFDVAHVLRQFDPSVLARIESDGETEVLLAGRSFRVGKGFVDDAQHQALGPLIGALRRPLLVLHAPRDGTVGIENANLIFAAARHPKSFISLDDADHLLSQKEDAEFAAAVIATWAQRYLPAPGSQALSPTQ